MIYMILKRHILNKYGNFYENGNSMFKMNDRTSITEEIETSDPDEFVYSFRETLKTNHRIDDTVLTFEIESSDPDEMIYLYDKTTETRIIESSDPDEFLI